MKHYHEMGVTREVSGSATLIFRMPSLRKRKLALDLDFRLAGNALARGRLRLFGGVIE